MKQDLVIEDSTLREGEQSPGISFNLTEKVAIAKMLQDLGVDAIEVGTPAMRGPEEEAIRAIVREGLRIRVIGWNRGRRSDLEASFDCGLSSVHIGLPSSDYHLREKFHKDRRWVIETMQELVAYAKSQGAWVSVSAEDIGRADVGFLAQYASASKEAGADRLRISDTLGVLTPVRVRDLVTKILEISGQTIQVHMHNDFGMATANTLAGVEGGAQQVHVTVNGLGERAGIAAIDEVTMGLTHLLGYELHIRFELLGSICQYVAHASGRSISPNKPITGKAIFEHESGIHVEGILRAPDSFEPFPPEQVGAERHIVIGKHSGSGAVQYVLFKQGISADRAALTEVVKAVRYEATRKKRPLDPTEVAAIYHQCHGDADASYRG